MLILDQPNPIKEIVVHLREDFFNEEKKNVVKSRSRKRKLGVLKYDPS